MPKRETLPFMPEGGTNCFEYMGKGGIPEDTERRGELERLYVMRLDLDGVCMRLTRKGIKPLRKKLSCCDRCGRREYRVGEDNGVEGSS